MLLKRLGTKLQFSSAYHSQTYGQTEAEARSLGNLFLCIVGNNIRTWDATLPHAEFAYNSSANRTTGKSPFEILYGCIPKQVVDLVPIPIQTQYSDDASAFAEHIRDIQAHVRAKIKGSPPEKKGFRRSDNSSWRSPVPEGKSQIRRK